VATYQATPAAQQAVTCAIAPGSVYVGGSGAIYDANTSALNYAIGQWNAAKVPVTFSTTAQYAGQSPDVQVAFSSLVPQNSFHLSGTCSSVTTLTLPMPNPVFTPTNNTAAINLEFLQGLGALMGLPDDTTLAKCASLMNLDAYNRLSQNECPSLEPTVWDVATVNSIYAPNATAGFPALSNITSTKWSLVPQAQSDAEGAPMVWANATTAASFQWTYVPWDTGSEGKAGYIVNADNGLCLSSGINSGAASTPIQMDCAAQNPQWDLLDTSVGTSVINIAGKFPLCIGQAVVGVAELVDCHSLSPLTIAPPGPGVPAGLAHVSVAPGYKIIGQGSSMCLNVWGGGYVSGTPVKVNTCAGTPNELFNYASNTKLVSVYDSTVTTPGSAAVASLCLTAQGDGTTNGTSIVASTCTPGEDDQMWTLEPNGNYTNAASGKCLTVQGASTSAGASVILWDCNSGSNEQWSMQTGLLPGSKLYSLIGNASGALSTSTSASNTVTNGATRFGVLTYNTPDTWSWLDNGGGQGLLEDDTNSGCLQVANAGWPYFAFSSSQNAQSALGTCVASPAGTLGLISNSDGTVSFSLPAVLNPQGDNTNYCLDIKGNNTSEGAPIYAYPCGSNYANQSWRILAPPEPAVINRPRRSFSLTMPNPVALIPPAPSEPLDPTMANPVITTTASSASAPEATSISDAVTISGTGGAALSVTWTLYGPVAPDSDGTCASANWSSSPPVISSGTLAANGDGTYTTPASSPLLSPGCFTWSESIPATTATAAVTTGLGVAGEVTTITEPLSG